MFKKENKKRRMSKKQENTHKKRKHLKDREKGRTCKNIQICEDVQQKGKNFWKCRSVKYVFQKEVIDRENKKRKKRQQMNKWMNKRTQRGNACM